MKIKVLHIEDDKADQTLVRRHIKKMEDIDFELTQTDRVAKAKEILKNQAFDVILLDLNLPDGGGRELYDTIHAQAPQTPIVVLSGTIQEMNIAISILQGGGQDYLLKQNLQREALVRSMLYAIERKRQELTLREKTDNLERFQKVAVGRELEMVKLKEEINQLLQRLGEPKKYS